MVENKIEKIIRIYRIERLKTPDSWIEFASNQKNIADAILISALCINRKGKRHPHQYRIKKEALKHFSAELLSKRRLIAKSENFDALFKIIRNTEIFGIGDLTKYDVATRLGAYMNLYPVKVYLHAGTLVGAKNLLGSIKKEFLTKKDLPKPFRQKNLQYWEIEDILCIFKNTFSNLSEFRTKIKSYC